MLIQCPCQHFLLFLCQKMEGSWKKIKNFIKNCRCNIKIIYYRMVNLEFWLVLSQSGFCHTNCFHKAWFSHSMLGKILDDRGFNILPTIPDFADKTVFRQRSAQIFQIISLVEKDAMFINCYRWTGAQQFRGLAMVEIHCRLMLMSLMVHIWVFIYQEWLPTIAEIWDAPGK